MLVTIFALAGAIVLSIIGSVQIGAPLRLQPLYSFLQWKKEPKKQLDAGVATRLGGLFDIALAAGLLNWALR